MLGAGFPPGQDPSTVAAMAALTQQSLPSPKKDRSSSSHESSSADLRGRKPKKVRKFSCQLHCVRY